jgi:hypothetical protein
MNLRDPAPESSVTSGRTVRCLKIGPIRWPGPRVSHLALNAVRDTEKAHIWESVSLCKDGAHAEDNACPPLVFKGGPCYSCNGIYMGAKKYGGPANEELPRQPT